MNPNFQTRSRFFICSLLVLGYATLIFVSPALTVANERTVNPFLQTAARAEIAQGQDQSEDHAVVQAYALSTAFRKASNRLLPTLVAIESIGVPSPEQGRGMPYQAQPSGGIGSGVIVDPSGVILTNNHVVMGGEGRVTVRLNDGREFPAKEVLTDPTSDIAVIRIEANGLAAAPMGDSDQAEIGDWVLALGQPFGLEHTVTAGIISAKQRGIGMTERESFLQTDAAINPGNSGGPLVNLKGEIIGINTAITSQSGGSEGVGFAIPINLARWIGGQLIEHGVVRRSMIGVGIQPIDATLATRLGVAPRNGLVVTRVQPGSPGAKAGLKTGDVLESFDGTPLSEISQLQLTVERCEPGVRKPIVVIRRGERTQLMIVPELAPLMARPTPPRSAATGPVMPGNEMMGLRVESLDPEIAPQLGIEDPSGVVVTAIARFGPAYNAGIQPGDVISEIEHMPIKDSKDYAAAIKESDPRDGILMLVHGMRGTRYVVVKGDA